MYKFAGKFFLSLALCTACVMPFGVQAAEESKDPTARLTPLTASITWLQTSAEYKGLCYQTYNMATQAIDDKLRLNSYVRVNGKLCKEVYHRQPDGSILHLYQPLAIVLDIDETVIDNSGVEAWCLINNIPYNEQLWSAWCQGQGAEPAMCREVPGAVSFLLYCQELGITPIYLTNRDESLREATLKALINLGLNTPDLNDRLILRDKKRDKAGAKKIVEDMKISAASVLGKDIAQNYSDKADNEMTNNREILQARNEQVKSNITKLGNTFFLLPNPIYGSWLKEQTVPPMEMRKYIDDYGFGAWYQKNKHKLHGTSGR